MPHITTDDGVKLYVEETGTGTPIIFVHEFAGDHRSWEPQVRAFARYYRCITYSARGFPPSDIPSDPGAYSQARARDDIKAVLDALGIDKAHIVGLSMGGFATLHFGFSYPERALSLVVGGCGYGAEPGERAKFVAETEATARRFDELGMVKVAAGYAIGPTRVQFANQDQRGVQGRRPSLYELVAQMDALDTPTLVITGDEDWPCLQPAVLMKRHIKTAGLVVMPNAGHTINLESPAAFNQHLADFFHAVQLGKHPVRDPRAMAATILGR
jgi:pimeloyl-ACP methyl ester carboxylesterase